MPAFARVRVGRRDPAFADEASVIAYNRERQDAGFYIVTLSSARQKYHAAVVR